MVNVFEQGDIVYLDFDPQAEHEQKGRRPALVGSNNLFNRVRCFVGIEIFDFPSIGKAHKGNFTYGKTTFK